METLKQKQLRILNETINTYTLNTRSIIDGVCVYFKDESQGCAVGRLIEDKKLCADLDINLNPMGKKATDVNCVFHRLPKDVQELSLDFLSGLQMLHDNAEYWTETGISYKGLMLVDRIKMKHKLEVED